MGYVEGESLEDRLAREGPLPLADALRIAAEVGDALQYAHEVGVLHRDVKPANILLSRAHAMVADFGIAKLMEQVKGGQSSLTGAGLTPGTAEYMSPEQAGGAERLDARSDVYALGAVLYEMLVGEAPFTGPSVQAIVARVMTENPRPVTGQRRSVPEHVNAAVLRALEKLPADRFHSAAEFSNALFNTAFAARGTPELPIEKKRAAAKKFYQQPFVPWVFATLAAVAAIFFAARSNRGRADNSPAYVSIDLPPDVELPATLGEVLG